ncbi:MAG: ABC transporter ATP-binding protein [Acidimicrobiia bacterium]
MLEIEGLRAGYADLEILHGIDLEVREGEVVALIGANGAGKTTTLKTISGVVRSSAGSISYDGSLIHEWQPRRVVAGGLVQVPEGRKLFPDLTVNENLHLGAYRRGREEADRTIVEVFELFPLLEERLDQTVSTLSGGEQQMLAIGRALMARPRLLMLDEPSLGLAPMLVADIFNVIRDIGKRGVTVMLVEQNAAQALQLSDRGYVLESGNIVLEGTGKELLGDDRVRSAYLGL